MITSAPRAALPCALAAIAATASAQVVRPTNYGDGADAEVRESAPDQNRGDSTELATRALDHFSPGDGMGYDPFDRNSVIYLQFDLTNLGAITTIGSTLRLTYRNNNLAEKRISDTDGMAPLYPNNGVEYYGIPGVSFDESTITYDSAPGLTPDGDVGTKDITGGLPLGHIPFPDIGTQSHLPVGGALDFASAALDSFLESEMTTNPDGVAVIAVIHRNAGQSYNDANASKPGDEPSDWVNFNYLFNPKEQTTLNDDSTYDANTGDDNNLLGSPWSQADNSTGEFSPQLILIPAPSTAAFLVAPLLLHRRRR